MDFSLSHISASVSTISDVNIADVWENLLNVSTEEFFSKKITNKLVQQLQVALVRWFSVYCLYYNLTEGF